LNVYLHAPKYFYMKVSVDISYYPLKEEFKPAIIDFIKRINTYTELTAQTNGMSTQIFGEYRYVMDALTNEIEKSFSLPHSVFVMKVINADLKI
jgi:uncharacterized protein YqgV (UPF0045/DUF77 family)